jgi:hypothetical protein
VSSLLDSDFLRPTKLINGSVLKLVTKVFADNFTTGYDSDIFKHSFSSIAESQGALTAATLKTTTKLVNN